MSYKTILTIWDGSDLAEARLNAAADLANRNDAHLTVLCFGVAPTMTTYAYGEGYAMIYADQMKAAQDDADALAAAAGPIVDRMTSRGEVRAIACGFESLARVMGEHARYADLVVMSPPEKEENSSLASRLLDGALLDGDTATLIIKNGGLPADKCKVMIAWDESHEALAAVRAAAPFLEAAEKVELVMVDPAPSEGRSDREPGADISLMLARHGYDVTVTQLPSAGQSIGTILNRHATDIGAGLLVMGAYSHSRFWESVLGGVTNDMLANISVPTLMAH
jgi:nucleotide-binding universal stress UspA family protein